MSPAVRNPGLWLAAAPCAPPLDGQLASRCPPRRWPPAPTRRPPPGWSPLPQIRARQLPAPRRRWSLARALRSAVAEIRGPAGEEPRARSPFSPRVPVRRAAVSEACEPLLELAAALTDPECDD